MGYRLRAVGENEGGKTGRRRKERVWKEKKKFKIKKGVGETRNGL